MMHKHVQHFALVHSISPLIFQPRSLYWARLPIINQQYRIRFSTHVFCNRTPPSNTVFALLRRLLCAHSMWATLQHINSWDLRWELHLGPLLRVGATDLMCVARKLYSCLRCLIHRLFWLLTRLPDEWKNLLASIGFVNGDVSSELTPECRAEVEALVRLMCPSPPLTWIV